MGACMRAIAAFRCTETIRLGYLRSPTLPLRVQGVTVSLGARAQVKKTRGGVLQPEGSDLLFRGSTLGIPPPRSIVLVQHRWEIDSPTGGRSFPVGLGKHPPWKRVVRTREAGGVVPQPFQVPDALADPQEVLGSKTLTCGGRKQPRKHLLAERETGEFADARGVEHGRQMLQVEQDPRRAPRSEAVDHLGDAQDLRAQHVAAQMT